MRRRAPGGWRSGRARRPNQTGIVACIAALLVAAAAAAMPEPSGPPAHLGPPRLDWSGEQLVAFAAASVRIEAELEAWTVRYAQADTPRTRSALLAANETAIRAVVEDVGLSLLQFDEIRRAAQGDPRLDARIAALVRRHWNRPEVGAPARR